MPTLKLGDAAPSFALLDQNGRKVKLSDFTGKRLLVYFYPKADTPGCTRQACSVRDHRADLSDLGIAVVGISPDTPEKQKKFDEKYGLGFPLLSDVDHTVYGRVFKGITRSSFLVDERGKITHVWYNVKPQDTVPKARQALAEAK